MTGTETETETETTTEITDIGQDELTGADVQESTVQEEPSADASGLDADSQESLFMMGMFLLVRIFQHRKQVILPEAGVGIRHQALFPTTTHQGIRWLCLNWIRNTRRRENTQDII